MLQCWLRLISEVEDCVLASTFPSVEPQPHSTLFKGCISEADQSRYTRASMRTQTKYKLMFMSLLHALHTNLPSQASQHITHPAIRLSVDTTIRG